MPITILDTDISGGGTAYTATATEETIFLTEGTTLVSTGSSGIHSDGTFQNTNVVVAGSIFTTGNAVNLRAGSPDEGGHSVTVLESGVIIAETFTGLLVEGANSIATNYGQITTTRSAGMYLSDSDFGTLINYGTVTATNAGIYSTTMSASNTATAARIENHGTLNSNGTVEGAVDIESSGTIAFLNTGTITAANAAYDSTNGAIDTVINSGLIQGHINLGSGTDSYRGFSGTVLGTIDGGAGDDTFFSDQADITIEGGTGTDTLFTRADVSNVTGVENIRMLGSDNLSVTGGDDPNTITGNGGDNLIEGMGGNDTIRGQAGDDAIYGFANDDVLNGGLGNDLLEGGTGNDTILGAQGADTIKGGTGQDLLSGQQGADTYVFDTDAEIGAGAAGDRILFTQGEDLVDVSGINDAAFNFIGGAGFSASGAMEIRAITAGSGHGVAMFDVNGDGVEDARLVLLSTPIITVDDFVL